MKNLNEPIYPTTLRQVGDNDYRPATAKDIQQGQYLTSYAGLTKLEYFAAVAMQGLISGGGLSLSKYEADMIAGQSVQFAESLLKQLNQTTDGKSK